MSAFAADPDLHNFARSLSTSQRREFAQVLGNLRFSRRQIAELTGVSAKTIHYDIAAGQGVTPDGRVTWPLWIDALLQRAETGESRTIGPGRGAPGSPELEALLWHQRRCEGAHVLVVNYCLPQVREPVVMKWTVEALNSDLRDVFTARAAWAQKFYPDERVPNLCDEETRKRMHGFKPKTLGWHPARRRGICMWASSGRRLHGQTVEELRETLDPWWGVSANDQLCARTVRTCIARGDALWAALGAWPWAAFPERIRQDWWRDERAWASMSAWFSDRCRPPDLETRPALG